jgi:hypothetical protein
MGNLFGSKNQTSTTQPSKQYQQAFNQLWPQAQTAASTASVAPINATQTAAIKQLNNAQTSANPYFTSAANMATQGGGSAVGGISQYLNPYQQDVTNATMANINETNAEQANNLNGNAITSGAWGGDRAGVAQAELARQQDLASNQTLADLNSNNYNTALSASQNDASRALTGASTLGGLGSAVQSGGVNAANALLGAGTLQQQTSQQQANLPMTEAQFLSSILNGSNLGSTTTTPGPSLISQIAGLGLAGASLFKRGGGIGAYADGGTPDADLDDDDSTIMGSLIAPPSPTVATAPVTAPPPQQGGLGATLASPADAHSLGLDDKHLAMLEAGLGILSSKSPFALQAVGEGGLQGLAAYRQQKQAEAEANYRNNLSAYHNSMAQTAEQRAQAQAELYNKRASQVGDQSWIESNGPTLTLVHKAGDGTVETHDLGIPTAAWQRTKQEGQRLGIEAGNAAEEKRHHQVTEKQAAGASGEDAAPWTQFQ